MWSHSVWILYMFILNTHTQSKRIRRVIGGTEVECGSQVGVASLTDAINSRHLCGAVFVNREVAVTAAHCVQEPIEYVLQLNNVCTNDLLPKARVLNITAHPQYDKFTRAHDIALLRVALSNDITWSNNTMLPNSSFALSGECIVYGYGDANSVNDINPNRLKAARLKIISLDECTRILGEFVAPRFDSGMICAVGDGVDTCQGDSGGPIMCEESLQGITSYGLSCGVGEVPGVYTSIGMHLPWILETIEYWKLENYS